MTQFFKKTAVYLLISFVCVAFLFALLLLLPNDYTKKSHQMNVVYSINRLNLINEPKIIIIGGSGCGMGIDSELLFLHYKKPIVNTGTHAGLGLRLQIELFKDYIQEGDIVILVPEYQQYQNDFCYGNATALEILSSTYPEGFKFVSYEQWVYLHKYIPRTFIDAISCKGIKEVAPPYSKESLNKFGDVTMYEQRTYSKVKLDDDLSKKRVDKYAIELLVEFEQYLCKKKATFFIFPPAYQASSFHQNNKFIEVLDKELSQVNCSFVAFPSRYALPDSLFFDTPYHLTAVGTQKRTYMLIEDIDQILSIK